MAQKKAKGPRKYVFDALPEDVVSDPAEVPKVRALAGYLGKSNRSGYLRLYITPELFEYLEFREEDVVRTCPFPPEKAPVGGTMVWVRGDATLLHTRTQSFQAQASFLEGDISAQFLSGMGTAGIGVGAPGVIASTLPCIYLTLSLIRCPTIHGCSVLDGFCPTRACTRIPLLCV
jgi:hypothetical protein